MPSSDWVQAPCFGNSLAVQWLGPCAFLEESQGSIPQAKTKTTKLLQWGDQGTERPGRWWPLTWAFETILAQTLPPRNLRWGRSNPERGKDWSMVMTHDLNWSRAHRRERTSSNRKWIGFEKGLKTGWQVKGQRVPSCSREGGVVSVVGWKVLWWRGTVNRWRHDDWSWLWERKIHVV